VIAFDAISTKKPVSSLLTMRIITLGALKGNQSNLLKTVKANFVAEASYTELSKGHGRREKQVISLCTTLDHSKPWPGMATQGAESSVCAHQPRLSPAGARRPGLCAASEHPAIQAISPSKFAHTGI
jgi:hypothetical protein